MSAPSRLTQIELLGEMSFAKFIETSVRANQYMIERCGDTEKNRVYNLISTLNHVAMWAEAHGHDLPEAMIDVIADAHGRIPGGSNTASCRKES